MFPAAFDYVRAESIGHALELLERHGDDARLLAGGHSLIPAMKLRLAQPKVLIDIGRLRELQYIRQEGNTVAVGSLTAHHQLESSPVIGRAAPALQEAAKVLADVQVRNKGTIGGALVHADPAADYPAVLLALGAEVVAAGWQGTRVIPIDSFFTGPFSTALNPGEILAEVRIPAAPFRSASVYRKFLRRANDYGIVGVAANLTIDEKGFCRAARIGVTCVAMRAFRPTATEGMLVGHQLNPGLIADAAERSMDGVEAAEDAFTTAEYRAHLTRVETRRAIKDAINRIM